MGAPNMNATKHLYSGAIQLLLHEHIKAGLMQAQRSSEFRGGWIMAINGPSFLTAALPVVAGGGLSGCVYDVGLGYASDGYYDDEYGCDPQGGTMPIMIVIMGLRSATSALAAASLATITIALTPCFCPTM